MKSSRGGQYMFFRWTSFRSLGLVSFILLALITGAIQQATPIGAQGEIPRDIISDDFLKNRPAKPRSSKNSKKTTSTYRLATTPTKQFDQSRLQVGLTIWKLEPVTAGSSSGGES